MNFAPWQTDFNLKCLFFFNKILLYRVHKGAKAIRKWKDQFAYLFKDVVFKMRQND